MKYLTMYELERIESAWKDSEVKGPVLITEMRKVFEHARELLEVRDNARFDHATPPEPTPRNSVLDVVTASKGKEYANGHIRDREAEGYEMVGFRLGNSSAGQYIVMHFRKVK